MVWLFSAWGTSSPATALAVQNAAVTPSVAASAARSRQHARATPILRRCCLKSVAFILLLPRVSAGSGQPRLRRNESSDNSTYIAEGACADGALEDPGAETVAGILEELG